MPSPAFLAEVLIYFFVYEFQRQTEIRIHSEMSRGRARRGNKGTVRELMLAEKKREWACGEGTRYDPYGITYYRVPYGLLSVYLRDSGKAVKLNYIPSLRFVRRILYMRELEYYASDSWPVPYLSVPPTIYISLEHAFIQCQWTSSCSA